MRSKSKNSYTKSDNLETQGIPNQYSPELTPTIPIIQDSEVNLSKDVSFVKELFSKDIKIVDAKIDSVKENLLEKLGNLSSKIKGNEKQITSNSKIFSKNFNIFWIVLAVSLTILFFGSPLLINREDSKKIKKSEENIRCFKDSINNSLKISDKNISDEFQNIQDSIQQLKQIKDLK